MAQTQHFVRADNSIIEVAWTDRSDGDFHVDRPIGELIERRSAVMAGPWTVVRQVHGDQVVDASGAAAARDVPLHEADGIVVSLPNLPISVQGADCAPIAFITDVGAIGVAHAGWRGLAAGIVEEVSNRLSDMGSSVERALIGPVICTDCYEFGQDDLDDVAHALGDDVRAQTATGTPALNMRAGLVAAFDAVGVSDVDFVGGCPSCDHTGFSHRARSEPERHCLVAKIVAEDGASG